MSTWNFIGEAAQEQRLDMSPQQILCDLGFDDIAMALQQVREALT